MKKNWPLVLALAFVALTITPKLAEATNAGDFSGGVAIGTSYAGTDAAPTNGMIVQGNVGIGTTSASSPLSVGTTGQFAVSSSGVPTFATQAAGSANTDGATTAYVDRGASGASEVLIATATASSSSSIAFTSIPSGYDHYILRITGVVPATTATTLNMVFSTDNGSSYNSTFYFNTISILENNQTTSYQSVVNGANFQMTGGVYNAAYGVYGTITLMLNQTNSSGWTSELGFSDTGDLGRPAVLTGSGELSTVTDVNAIKLSMSSGNITSGNFALYGVRNQ
jgi:hypothetical protein